MPNPGGPTHPEPEDDEEVTYFHEPNQVSPHSHLDQISFSLEASLHDIQLEIGILELQLLEIYNDIEVSNLALLQQSQEIEGTLESLKTKIREARAKNDAEINSLESQLAVSFKVLSKS